MPLKPHPTDTDKMVFKAIQIDDPYERGFIDGMQKQMQSSVDKAVNAMSKKEWHGLTDEEYEAMAEKYVTNCYFDTLKYARAIEQKLKGKNT
jgi:hypothetical protein